VHRIVVVREQLRHLLIELGELLFDEAEFVECQLQQPPIDWMKIRTRTEGVVQGGDHAIAARGLRRRHFFLHHIPVLHDLSVGHSEDIDACPARNDQRLSQRHRHRGARPCGRSAVPFSLVEIALHDSCCVAPPSGVVCLPLG
jgi:hypothetical protein